MSQRDQGRPAVPPVGVGQQPGWPTSPPPHRPLGSADPTRTGPYRLEAVLGAGGMGRVYLGRTPAGSPVAVKVVHREYAGDPSFRKRFEQEVAAARRVQGLYTVPVVDADLTADEPWLATAYVPGPSLQHAIAEDGPLPADAALGLVARVAEALQSIHAADVVHRDLKPSNILLTADGPKVIDFGIARAADVTTVTVTGMRTGTPAYMAPEYIRGQEVTAAGDVFALGVVAHYAATGHLAFGADHAMAYRILEQAPNLVGCPDPLRTIAAHCLEKDPARRPTPAQVIEQCRGISPAATTDADAGTRTALPPPRPRPRPGTATPATPAEPGAPLTPGAPGAPTAQGSLGAGTPPASAAAPHAPTEVVTPAGPTTPPATDAPPDTPTAAPAAPPGPGLAALLSGVGIVVLAVILIAVNLPGSDKPHGPHYPYPDSGPTATLAFPAKAKGADGLAFSPDGRTLATGSEDGEVRLWDVTRRKVRASLKQSDSIGNEFGSRSVAFSPDGKLLATGLDNGAMAVWDVAGRRRLRQLDQAGEHVEFSPDGKLLATGSESGPVLLWDPHKHTNDADDIEAYFDEHMDVTSLAFSPDGRTLAAGGDDSGSNLTPIDAALLWDVAGRKPGAYGQGDPRATLEHGGPVLSVAYSPDGKTLATGGRDGRVRLWDTASRRPKATFTADGSGNPDPYTYVPPVSDLAFSPDGRTLAATTDNGVMLWNPATRKPRAILTSSTKGDGDKIGNVAFSSDGRLVAGNGTKSHTVLLWKNPAWKNPS